MAGLDVSLLPTADALVAGSNLYAAKKAAAVEAAKPKTVELTPDEQAEVDARTELALNPRSAPGEIWTGLERGVMYNLPNMIGGALKATGKPGDLLYGAGSGIQRGVASNDYNYALDKENHGAVVNALAEGGSMVAPSVAPIVSMLIPGAGPEVAGALGGALFGMSQFQDTYEKAKQAGKTDEEAYNAGLKTGAIEAGGEMIGTKVLGGLITGAGKSMLKGVAADGAYQAIKNPKLMLPLLKDTAETALVETGTEMGQSAGEAAVERNAGIDNTSPFDAATSAIGPTLGMMAFMGPLAAFGMHHRQQAQRTVMDVTDRVMTDPQSTTDQRLKASKAQADLVAEATGDKHAAELWRLDRLSDAESGILASKVASEKAAADAQEAADAQAAAVARAQAQELTNASTVHALVSAAKEAEKTSDEDIVPFSNWVAAQRSNPKFQGEMNDEGKRSQATLGIAGSLTQEGARAGYVAYLQDYLARNTEQPVADIAQTHGAEGRAQMQAWADNKLAEAPHDAVLPSAFAPARDRQGNWNPIGMGQSAFDFGESSQPVAPQPGVPYEKVDHPVELGSPITPAYAESVAKDERMARIGQMGAVPTGFKQVGKAAERIAAEQAAAVAAQKEQADIVRNYTAEATKDADARTSGADIQRVLNQRKDIVSRVLDDTTVPVERKTAVIQQQLAENKLPATLNPTEQAVVQRHSDVHHAFTQEWGAPLPSAPNEMDVYKQPVVAGAPYTHQTMMDSVFKGVKPESVASGTRTAVKRIINKVASKQTRAEQLAALKAAHAAMNPETAAYEFVSEYVKRLGLLKETQNAQPSEVAPQVNPGAEQNQNPAASASNAAERATGNEATGDAQPIRNDEKAGQVAPKKTAAEPPATRKQDVAKAEQKAKKAAAEPPATRKQDVAKAEQKAKKVAAEPPATRKQDVAKAEQKAKKAAAEPPATRKQDVAKAEQKAKVEEKSTEPATDNRQGGNAEWKTLGETETAGQRVGDSLAKSEWQAFEIHNYDSTEAHALGTNYDWVMSVVEAASDKASAAAKEALAWLKSYAGNDVVKLARERKAKIEKALGLSERMSQEVAKARKQLYDQIQYDAVRENAEANGIPLNFDETDQKAMDKFLDEHPLTKAEATKIADEYADELEKLMNIVGGASKHQSVSFNLSPLIDVNTDAFDAMRAAKATTVGKMLESVRHLMTPQEQILMDMLMGTPGVASVAVKPLGYDRYEMGHYEFDPANRYVGIRNTATVQAMLHEAVHVATHSAIAKGQNKARMDRIFIQAMSALDSHPEYIGSHQFKNQHEFVAEAFTNPAFQKFLSTIKPTNATALPTSLWDKFKSAVRAMIGVTDRTLLDEIFEIAGGLYNGPSEHDTAGFAHQSIAGTMQSVKSVIQDLSNKAERTFPNLSNMGATTRKHLYGLSTANHLKELVKRSPELAHMAPSVKAFFDTFDVKTNVIQDGRQEFHSYLRKVEMSLAKAGRDRSRMDARMMELSGEMSRLGVDLDKSFVENQKANADLTESDRTGFMRLQNKWKATSKETQGYIKEGVKLNRKYYIMNTAAVLYNILDSYSGTTQQLIPIMDRLDVIANKYVGENKRLGDNSLYLDSQSEHYANELATAFKEISALIAQQGGDKSGLADVKESVKLISDYYNAAVKNPYVHLGRSGNYFVAFEANPEKANTSTAGNGTALGDLAAKYRAVVGDVTKDSPRVFIRFETQQQALNFQAEAEKGGFITGDSQQGRINDKGALGNAAGVPAAMRAMLHRLDDVMEGMTDAQKATIRGNMQRIYIEMLPESSPGKANAQRKDGGRPGYDAGFVHNFAKRAEGMTASIANAYTMPKFDQELRDMKEKVDSLTADKKNFQSQVQSQELFMELLQRFSNSINPVESPAIDTIKALGYNFYLALSPAFMLVNTLQPYHLSLPVIGGRHGFAATASKMFSSAGISMKLLHDTYVKGWKEGKFIGLADAELMIQGLSPQHQMLVHTLMQLGKLDFTQAHELGRMAAGESHGAALAAKVASLGSHITEINNRLTTAFTAFDLELAKQMAQPEVTVAQAAKEAVDYAARTVDATQFNYADHNIARYLGRHGVLGKVTPLVMSFQQYSFQSMELLARLTRDAFGAANPNMPDAKKEAQKALAGVSVMTMGIAGILGLPFANVAAALLDSLGGMTSSGDDPWDVKVAFRNWLASVFGKDVAEVMARGLPHLAGVDISGRAGMQDILPGSRFLTDKREFADKVKDGALSAFGPAVNAAVDVGTMASHLSNGDVLGALTLGLPLALRNPAKAAKLMDDGFSTKTGNELPIPLTSWDVLNQALGFTPSKKSEQSEANFAFKTREAAINKYFGRITNDLYQKVEKGGNMDKEMQTYVDALERNPMHKTNLAAGLAARAKARAVAEASGTGIATTMRNLPKLENYRFANTGIPQSTP